VSTITPTSFTASLARTQTPEEVTAQKADIVWAFSKYLNVELFMKRVTQASREEDLGGVDFFIQPPNGDRIGVDVIKRYEDTVQHWHRGEAEATVELVSRVEDETPSKFAKENGPAYYLYLFSERPDLAIIVPGPVLRQQFKAGKFLRFPERNRTVKTFRPDYQATWHTLVTYVTISELQAICPGTVVIGNPQHPLQAAIAA
jgi:hypothetical protein